MSKGAILIISGPSGCGKSTLTKALKESIHDIYFSISTTTHSKLVVIDGEIAFLGTANFDYRSMYQNFEISLLILGSNITELERRIESDILNSKKVTLEEYKNRGKKERVLESISKLLAPIL